MRAQGRSAGRRSAAGRVPSRGAARRASAVGAAATLTVLGLPAFGLPAGAAAPAAAGTVAGQVSGSGSLAGLVVRPEALETASPDRYAPDRGCDAPCTTTSSTGSFSVAAAAGGVVSAVRDSDGAGIQVTVPASGTLPTLALWTSPVTVSTGSGHLALSWTAPAGGASSYTVELQSNGQRLGTLTTAKTTATVDARLVEDSPLIALVRGIGTVDGAQVQWQAPFALVPTTRAAPQSRGAECVVTTAAGTQARDPLSACGLADGDLTDPAILPGGANPTRAALDLGTSQPVGLVVVRTQGLVVVQTSDDGTTWTNLPGQVDQDPVTGAYVQLLATPVSARYVGVIAAAGTSAAPATSAAPTPPAETSSAPAPVVSRTPSKSPTPAKASVAPTTAPVATTSAPAVIPTVVPTTAAPTTTAAAPTTTSPAPTTMPPTTTAPPAAQGERAGVLALAPAAQGERAGVLALAPAAPAGALPVLAELSVWTGTQPALSGDVAPKAVDVPGVPGSSATHASGSSSALPLLGGAAVAVLVVGVGGFLVLRRRGRHAMGS